MKESEKFHITHFMQQQRDKSKLKKVLESRIPHKHQAEKTCVLENKTCVENRSKKLFLLGYKRRK